MSSNSAATVPILVLLVLGCVLAVLGVVAGGSLEVMALGLGAVALAAVLGTTVAVFGGRRS